MTDQDELRQSLEFYRDLGIRELRLRTVLTAAVEPVEITLPLVVETAVPAAATPTPSS